MTLGSSDPMPEGFVDRVEFLAKVGIDSRTLTRWIREGVVNPQGRPKDGRRIQIFSDKEVSFARAVRLIQKQHHGQLNLRDAVAIVRGEAARPASPRDPTSSTPLGPLTE